MVKHVLPFKHNRVGHFLFKAELLSSKGERNGVNEGVVLLNFFHQDSGNNMHMLNFYTTRIYWEVSDENVENRGFC